MEFPMESMASLIGALQLGLRARMRTNAEQEAIRLEFERTVSDRIRESRARESLLLDEKRRMEMRHKDEEDRLSETLSKLKLELKDLQAAEERRRSALQAAVDRRETELAAAADDAQHSLHDALAAAKSGLAEDGAKHVADEARLRKVRLRFAGHRVMSCRGCWLQLRARVACIESVPAAASQLPGKGSG